MIPQTTFATVCAMCIASMVSACQTAPVASSTATSAAICDAWEGTLFLPSRKDTPETALGLNLSQDVHRAACAGITRP